MNGATGVDEPTQIDQGDALAFGWLAALQRLDWKKTSRRKMDGQITIRLSPHGKLRRDDGSRVCSYVIVHVSHPRAPKRVKGTGNTLAGACVEVWRELDHLGVSLPNPLAPDCTQAQWDAIRKSS